MVAERLRENWFAVNRPSIAWGAPIRVIHLFAPRLLLRRVFPQPVKRLARNRHQDPEFAGGGSAQTLQCEESVSSAWCTSC
jgi:hypothetical protein